MAINRQRFLPSIFFCHCPTTRGSPEYAEGGLWSEMWVSQEGGLGELDPDRRGKVGFSARLTARHQLNLHLEMSAFVIRGKHSHFGINK